MRVLHLDLGRQMRGGQYQVLHLMEELSARGVAQRFLSPHGEPFAIRKLRRDADIVHAHDAKSHTVAALFANAPLVVSRTSRFQSKIRGRAVGSIANPFCFWPFRTTLPAY